MISLGTGPGGGGFVTTLAGRGGRNVTAVLAARNRAVMAACTTGGYRHIGMKLGRCPTGIALVAGRAVGRRCDMVGGLASRIASVMACGAGGGRCKRAVIRFGARPTTGGFVATLAGRGGRNVTAVLTARNRAVMAARTTGGYRHIGVKLGRRPGRVALVAGAAIRAGAYVIGILASGVVTVVTTRAVRSRGERTVISFRTLPFGGRAVAGLTSRRGGKVTVVLAARNGAVMTV